MKVSMTYDDAEQVATAVALALRTYKRHAPGSIGGSPADHMLGALVGALVAERGAKLANEQLRAMVDALESHAELGEDDVPFDRLEIEIAEGHS